MPEPCAAAENLEKLSPADEAAGFRGFLTGVVMFILGGCGLAYEYTFSKLASDLLGNTVQQWAIVIALMLFAMGMGAEIQRHIRKERIADRLIESQFLLALFGGFGPIALLAAFAFAPMYFALVQYGFCALIGLLIGLEIPLIIRINESGSSDMRLNLARVLKMDYIGALVGALLWVFLLIKVFSITEIGFVLGLTTLATAAFCLYLFREQVQRPMLSADSGRRWCFGQCLRVGLGFAMDAPLRASVVPRQGYSEQDDTIPASRGHGRKERQHALLYQWKPSVLFRG